MYSTSTFLMCLFSLTFWGCATSTPVVTHQTAANKPQSENFISFVGSLGNKEPSSTPITTPLPEDFITTVSDLEEHFHTEWEKFDRNNQGLDFYYGIVRGNAFGEFKAATDEKTKTVKIIFIYKQDLSGYGISKPQLSQYSIANENPKFSTIHKAQDIWGPLTVSITAEGLNKMQFIAGQYKADHGMFGKYSGQFYGIPLHHKERSPVATIKNKQLLSDIISAANLNHDKINLK